MMHNVSADAEKFSGNKETMWTAKETVLLALPLRILSHHEAAATALMSNREGANNRKMGGKEGKYVQCWYQCLQVSAGFLPQGTVLPRYHCEKEHSSPSRKIHKGNKPTQRIAAQARK